MQYNVPMAYVSLTPHLEKFIQGEVKSGRYSSPSEVIRGGIRHAREQMERGEVYDREEAFRQIRGQTL